MSSRLDSLRNSITFKLTFAHAACYLAVSLLIATMTYHKIAEYSHNELQKRMLEQLRELREMLADSGESTVFNDMKTVTKTSHFNLRFFRLFDRDEKIVREYIHAKWKKPFIDRSALEAAKELDTFRSVNIPGSEYGGLVLYAPLGKKYLLQCGFSKKKETRQLKKVRNMFLGIIFFAILPLSLLAGWGMAKYATKEMRVMADIATRIKNGDLSLRMPDFQGKNEIRSLSTAFNEMLDKLNLIISEHKESTDHIAHDLRSPLTHILGAIELLITKKRPPEEYEQALVSTMNSIVELQKLIDSLLDISLMETSILSDRKLVKIDTMLKKVLDVFQYALEAKNIRFEYICEVDGVMRINESLMTRAIANLLDNAVKFTPIGGFIRMCARTSDSNFTLTLENEGAPIAEKDVSRIFDRLYRADTARTEPGFGLGLSFVKAMVEAHGGSISVTNSPNGPTFTVTIPNTDAE